MARRGDHDADPHRAVARLLYEYARRVDDGDFEGVAALFARGTYRAAVGDDVAVFRGAQVAELLAATVRVFDDGTPRTRHLVTNVAVDVEASGRAASATSYFTVVQAPEPGRIVTVAAGTYDDRFRCEEEGEWWFADRLIRTDLLGDVSSHLVGDPFAGA